MKEKITFNLLDELVYDCLIMNQILSHFKTK